MPSRSNSIASAAFLLATTIGLAVGMSYEYGMFENFELTHKVFLSEMSLVSQLRQLRQSLAAVESALKNCSLEGDECVRQASEPMRKAAAVKTRVLQWEKEESGDLPTTADLEGAMRGLLVLRDTYNVAVDDFRRGDFSASVAKLVPEGFLSAHHLSLDDVFSLSVAASKSEWYDTSVLLLREAFVMYQENNRSRIQDLGDTMERLRRYLVATHNQMLKKRRKLIGDGFRLLPYLLNATLGKDKQQPKFLKSIVQYKRDAADVDEHVEGERKDEAMRRICRGDLVGAKVQEQLPERCVLLHQNDPYLRLGPFNMEIVLRAPFRMLLHDFLSARDIDWIVEYSKPRLSRKREHVKSNEELKKNQRYSGDSKKVRIVTKTVQCWMQEALYEEEDPVILDPILYALAKRIEIATKLVLTKSKYSSTLFQTTNYGLSGLCESHIDPHGYIEGVELPPDRKELENSGDMLATFMGYLADVDGGGATAFDAVDYEQAVWPRKGAAAFWIDLDRKGYREFKSSHSGCPVLKGSKWILNKWIYSYDQFKNFPCGLAKNDTYPPFELYY